MKRNISTSAWRFLLGGALLVGACSRFDNQTMRAHEIGAIHELESIAAAETQFFSVTGRYGGSFGDLQIPDPDAQSGYVFRMAVSPAGFEARANPVEFGKTGARCFFVDQTLTIRQSTTTDPANASSPEIN